MIVISSKAIRGIKLQLCRLNVHIISLYKNYVFTVVAQVLSLLWHLKAPVTCNGKNENWYLLLSHCRYVDKSFTEIFREKSSAKFINCVRIAEFDWLPWQRKMYICEKNIKNHLLRSHNGDEAETMKKSS